jgi:hypothetical protein
VARLSFLAIRAEVNIKPDIRNPIRSSPPSEGLWHWVDCSLFHLYIVIAGYWSEEEALRFARAVSRDNALRVFNLDTQGF